MQNALTAVSDASFAGEVLASPVPVLVEFWGEWCAPCKQVEPALAAAAERYGGRLRIVRMDVDANPVTHARYGVRSCPTLLVFRGGEVVDSSVGAPTPAKLEAFVESACAPAGAMR